MFSQSSGHVSRVAADNNAVSRNSTRSANAYQAPRVPTTEMGDLLLADENAPPPPDYQTALIAGLNQAPVRRNESVGHRQTQGSHLVQGSQYSAPSHPPPQHYDPPPHPPSDHSILSQELRYADLHSAGSQVRTNPSSTQSFSGTDSRDSFARTKSDASRSSGSSDAFGAATQTAVPKVGTASSRPNTSSVGMPSRSTGTEATRRSSVEDPLASLAKYDLKILVDDSPSMWDLWQETRAALMGLVDKTLAYDQDGIDLYFMNHSQPLLNVVDSSTVAEAFDIVEPSGSTPTGYVLDDILRPYIESIEDAKVTKKRVKPLIVICLTDGRADDSELVKEILVEMASRLDEIRAPPFQLGVQFIQVGSDSDATEFLKELDDDLKADSGVRDIVDTTLYQGRITPGFILKCMLGSVNKRLDSTSSDVVH